MASATNEAAIIVNQDGINSFGSALLNAQTYEIFLDDQMAGVLDGYRSQHIFPLPAGAHSVYVRAYARDSVSVTRVYGYSQRYDVKCRWARTEHFPVAWCRGRRYAST
jgi:hypothetical protein